MSSNDVMIDNSVNILRECIIQAQIVRLIKANSTAEKKTDKVNKSHDNLLTAKYTLYRLDQLK